MYLRYEDELIEARHIQVARMAKPFEPLYPISQFKEGIGMPMARANYPHRQMFNWAIYVDGRIMNVYMRHEDAKRTFEKIIHTLEKNSLIFYVNEFIVYSEIFPCPYTPKPPRPHHHDEPFDPYPPHGEPHHDRQPSREESFDPYGPHKKPYDLCHPYDGRPEPRLKPRDNEDFGYYDGNADSFYPEG